MKTETNDGSLNECELSNKKKVINFLKTVWDYVNIFDIPKLTREIGCDVKHIRKYYDDSQKAIEEYKLELEAEKEKRNKEQSLFINVMDQIDDMLWAKDLDGKYIVANKAFRNKFCYGISWDELQNKTDQELAKRFKKLVGEENHTFGELCSNSDVIIHRTKIPKEFLEHGMINGEMMKLIVNKSPAFDKKGNFYATCGTGRIVTTWHNSMEEAIKKIHEGCSCFGQEETEMLLKELNKLKFEEGDHNAID